MAEWGKESDFQRSLYRVGKAMEELRETFYSEARPVDVRFRKAGKGESPAALDVSSFGGESIRPGFKWADGAWNRAFFLVETEIPAEFAGRRAVLRFDTGSEAVAFRDGIPVQGLDANRDDLVLCLQARGGERHRFLVEAVSVDAFGRRSEGVLKRAELCVFNPEMYSLYYDLAVLHWLAHGLGEEDPWARRILFLANKAVDVWRDEWSEPHPRARARLARKTLEPVFQERASSAWPEVWMAGHAHIDVAWLWPLEETVRKCSRTFSTAVRYLAEYPEFRFSQSQAVLYEMTKEHFPSLYRSISEMVAEGRWEPVGGMWVESDCNMTGAEALVRQFLYGKRFFLEEFGLETDVCWLPDTFGFPASLPQILKKCGIDFFATAKIRWNLYTRFPHSTFHWKGIDGSEVLSHLLYSGNYNTRVLPDELIGAARGFTEADRSPALFLSFGYGDGGGGPTRGQIERCRRVGDLFGLPRTRLSSISGFFHHVRERSTDLPVHRGELYLEIHRGTLTSQARTKRNNRLAELALRRLEALISFNEMLGTGLEWSKDDLDRLWKSLLTLQFHDVLPGSSIAWVYEDAEKMYREIFSRVSEMEGRAAARIAALADAPDYGTPYLVFNYLSWERCGLAGIPLAEEGDFHAVSADGEPLPCQVVEEEDGERTLLVEVPRVPPMGYAVVLVAPGKSPVKRRDVRVTSDGQLVNEVLRLKVDSKGRLASLVDRRVGTGVLGKGSAGNLLQLFRDVPLRWEAWDFDEDFERVGTVLEADSVEVVEEGPVRASVKAVFRFGSSELVQFVRLYSHLPWVEFETVCDWRERKKLLKAAFPLALDPGEATYEIQFGAVRRPTTRNDLKERGMFEVPAHRWADISEPGYGVSLLNDCKYGYDAADGTLRLSLLRGPESPDPEADLGRHEFSYALYPHKGDWRDGRTVRAGYEFNVPLAVYEMRRGGGELPPSVSFVTVDSESVVIEALKPAEDGSGVVVRAYEAHGERAAATFSFDVPIEEVVETDLLERPVGGVAATEGSFDVVFGPFEIRTFKVRTA